MSYESGKHNAVIKRAQFNAITGHAAAHHHSRKNNEFLNYAHDTY